MRGKPSSQVQTQCAGGLGTGFCGTVSSGGEEMLV